MPRRAVLAEFAGFQLVWCACVVGAAQGTSVLGVLAALAFVGLRLGAAPARGRAWAAVAAVALLGALTDTLLARLGWLSYACAPAATAFAPAWIVALWAAFAATFRSSMAWLTRRAWLCGLCSAACAPISYLGAERLGALSLQAHTLPVLAGIGLVWACAVPAAVALERRVAGASRTA